MMSMSKTLTSEEPTSLTFYRPPRQIGTLLYKYKHTFKPFAAEPAKALPQRLDPYWKSMSLVQVQHRQVSKSGLPYL